MRGLYAITSAAIVGDTARLLNAARAVLRGGAVLLQYRDKWNTPELRLHNASALAGLCAECGARLIINDDPALAARSGAHGVHLGADDASITEARRQLGPGAIIGATCGDDLERARTAIAAGADYIAFGRFFPSRTKPDAPPAHIETLTQACAQFTTPICAIGGITPDNAGPLLDAGASLIAAIDGLFGADDPEQAARRYLQAFAITRGR